ncbi:nitric oxide reductase activation protein [Parasulfuritortus cantonensis]|uniref:Nitric oxide reductase activation protein n=1 Tax=Parasulfuritortus cantonensis TaxID=2528202 RepID=A0A4R1B8L9_9PROT|nr:VWA domain-containing protein [Parasulfuritortus cantonensis]TCJ13448.1 nitric oxide reductase activation protein [Parasulfuritortus cantonensis]
MAEPLTRTEIEAKLDVWLETEFTFHQVGPTARALCRLGRTEQDFVLDWIKRIATTHITLAFDFAKRAPDLIRRFDRRVIEAWAVHLCDTYDRAGMYAALEVAGQVGQFMRQRDSQAAGALFEDVAPVLANFVHGLTGRKLKLEQGEAVWSDGEKIVLPAIIAELEGRADNFKLAKAMVAFQWAHTRYGTLRADWQALTAGRADPARALRQFHGLETLRLAACLARELPGLYRDMSHLSALLEAPIDADWQALAAPLAEPGATLADSLARLDAACALADFPARCYQGELRPDAVAAARAARLDKEKARLRVKLADLAEEARKHKAESGAEPDSRFEVATDETDGRLDFEITLDGAPVAPPDDVKQLLTSVHLDFGAIPPEYLVPAGDGEYDASQYEDQPVDPDAVWQGTYHEEGALFYPEWDLGRQHYRKNWCVMREKEVKPVYDDFPVRTLAKYSALVKQLRTGFEAMRDENRLLKRQTQGDEVDLDALVEALADAHDGREMSDRLFMHMHRAERNIAVAFMVDMSGSTRGWINEAEREALILLCEALERLGDRYAIYGFSGITRKRCELFRIKTFDEPYTDEVRARIAGIAAQEYTRMGFAIRHLSKLLGEVEARTRVLVTLSDGRPDDYFDPYRGPYGIEDTRMALLEARRAGIHPFCITIDKDARDYLPHMYGPARYVILDDVGELPGKVADIYRRLTH